MSSAIITSVSKDGSEYNIIGLLRSLELLDINLNIYIGVFSNPPDFDLIQELEVCGNLHYDGTIDDSDLETSTKKYFSNIIGSKYDSIVYIDHCYRLYKIPTFEKGISTITGSYETTAELEKFMKSSMSPELFEKCIEQRRLT